MYHLKKSVDDFEMIWYMINFDLECPSLLIDYQLCDLEHKL